MTGWWARLPGIGTWQQRRRARLCEEAARRIQELVDGEVPSGSERRRLERHVESCAPCGAGAETIRELKEAIARVGSRTDPQVKARLVELLAGLREGRVPPDPGP